MCGIAGFYGFKNDKLIRKISKELEHRGPDGEGFYSEDNVTLLNRRLAIIDVKGGDQPIYNEDKSVVVVYNGEIYNYRELRKELESSGHTFKTKSDTEVIVHGYESWGDKCFVKFNGMFAVALYDKKNKRFILARDHFGIKPLYYAFIKNSSTQFLSHESLTSPTSSEGPLESEKIAFDSSLNNLSRDTYRMIFSSEIKPIINSGLIKKNPNDGIIYRYLAYRIHDDTKETFFEGIYRLLPGEMMVVDEKGHSVKKFSNLQNELLKSNGNSALTDKEIAKFKHELEKAIRYRLISEVPVGTCLSGGLDSSIVVAEVNKLLQKHVKEAGSLGKYQKTFSAVFPGSTNDEEKYIDNLKSQMSNIKSYKITPKAEEFFTDLQDFIRTQEEPTISTGPYAQFKVMQMAHKEVTVLLDGQGLDEMMAGYLPYYLVYLRQLWKEKDYIKLVRESILSMDILLVQFINQLNLKLGIKKIANVSNMLNPEFKNKHKDKKFNVTSDNLKKRLAEDIFGNSLQSLLRYEDKNTMRFSIEGRVPFLDYNLVRFLFGLSNEAIIKNGWNKYILRKSTEDLLPEMISKRRNKIGFTTPEHEWFLRMKNKIYSLFLSESFANRRYFNQQEVLKSFRQFIEGKTDDTMVFWRLLNLELWMREFIDMDQRRDAACRVCTDRKEELGPNKGKKLEIEANGKTYLRYPIKTELFKKGDDYAENIAKNIVRWLNFYFTERKDSSKHFLSHESLPAKTRDLESEKIAFASSFCNKKWFAVVSEKIIAISQGRSYFIRDIHPTIFAKLLSNFVTRTPTGIGLGSPWTMQIAIEEVGLPRIMFASVMSAIAKIAGFKGLFYRIAGETVRSIDGPTEYSLYPSNVSAKLGPMNPQIASKEIFEAIKSKIQSPIFKKNSNFKLQNKENTATTYILQPTNFLGVVIIDANDIGRNVLGNSTGIDDNLVENIMADNPMGQADEQTPIILVKEI